jgi:hypothetical protein
MSTHSAKTQGRSAKTARGPDKKASKAARATAKKPSKSARRPVGKATRQAPAALARAAAPSVAPATPAMIRTASPPVQPAAPDVPVHAHRYRVGETVYYTSPTFGRAAASGSYTVMKLLPSEGDDYQYRIKSSGEAFERVAKESQLDKA